MKNTDKIVKILVIVFVPLIIAGAVYAQIINR